MAYGLSDPRGYDGMGPRDLSDLLDVSLEFNGSLHLLTHPAGSPLVSLLNVKYVFGQPGLEMPASQFTRVLDGPSPLYVNRDVIPRLFLADGYTVRTGNLARRTLRDGLVDLRRTAILESELPGGLAPEPGGTASDGRPTEILRASFAFRAVSVPAGRHTIRFGYRPASVAWGAAVSVVALAGALALFWRGR
jgi:hypothetical protein